MILPSIVHKGFGDRRWHLPCTAFWPGKTKRLVVSLSKPGDTKEVDCNRKGESSIEKEEAGVA